MKEDYNSSFWQGRHLRRLAAFIQPERRVTDSTIGGSPTYNRDLEAGARKIIFLFIYKTYYNKTILPRSDTSVLHPKPSALIAYRQLYRTRDLRGLLHDEKTLYIFGYVGNSLR
jgi:hypothetical protein